MRYYLSSKKKLWENSFKKHSEFLNTFLSFEPNHSFIPFHLLFKMHFSEEMVFHFLRQFLIILYILYNIFGISHNSLTIENLQIRKTEFSNSFLFLVDENHKFLIDCPYGYHIYISDFEECFFKHSIHPFYLKNIPTNWNPIYNVMKFIKKHISNTKFNNLFKNIVKNIRINLYEEDSNIFLHISPLIEFNRLDTTSSNIKELEKIKTEIKRTFKIFLKEYELLKSKFSNERSFGMMIDDWIEILYRYKSDFFKDPDTTINILRKILYQYTVEHSFTHISFKSFDLSRMIISLYLWSEWYDKLSKHIFVFDLFNNKQFTILLACLEIFFNKPSLHYENTQHNIHVFDFVYDTFKIQYCNKTLNHIHPILRTEFLYKLINNSN